MITLTDTSKRKALRGTISRIEHNCTLSAIHAEVEEEGISVSSKLPKAELARLNLAVGDTVDIFPLGLADYFIIGKSY
jgi:molybdopterin-binding protein